MTDLTEADKVMFAAFFFGGAVDQMLRSRGMPDDYRCDPARIIEVRGVLVNHSYAAWTLGAQGALVSSNEQTCQVCAKTIAAGARIHTSIDWLATCGKCEDAKADEWKRYCEERAARDAERRHAAAERAHEKHLEKLRAQVDPRQLAMFSEVAK